MGRNNLFAYGTLMCVDIMVHVSTCRPPRNPGVLCGYHRWCVRGEEYPAIAPEPAGRVDGIVYRDLPPAAWKRLDRFEGVMYRRQTVHVELEGAGMVCASAYVLSDEFLHRLERRDWDFAAFLKNGKARFTRRYTGYEALD